jgi:hypothetical protein
MWARVVLVMVFGLLSHTAAAQDFVGARALSLGESYRAIATGNDALYFNPAGLPLLKRYSIEGQYILSLADERHVGDFSIVDSKTNPLAVGLAYTFLGAELTKRQTIGHTATLGMAYPIFDKLFSVGVGLKYKSVSDAIAHAVGVRAESCTTEVPNRIRVVSRPHQASGVNASEPHASAVNTVSKFAASATATSSA